MAKKIELKEVKKEKPTEKPAEEKAKVYVCTEDCYHCGALYQKGDIYAGEPPKGKDGQIRHFEVME